MAGRFWDTMYCNCNALAYSERKVVNHLYYYYTMFQKVYPNLVFATTLSYFDKSRHCLVHCMHIIKYATQCIQIANNALYLCNYSKPYSIEFLLLIC